YGVLQYQGSDAPASIDVTLDNQNQTLSVPAGKFPGIVWFNGSGEELENIPRGTESVSLSAFLATNNTSFKVRLRDGTSNALPNGIGGGESWCEFTLVDKRTPATVSVTGVTLNESAKTLTVGETFQLTPNVQPPTATDPGVTWSVAPAGIVAVGTSGLVTAQAKGQATVTVKTNDGNHTAQCVVTVVPKKHRVHFSHTGSGALTATVDNAPIQTGDEVEAGKTVV
ncbi:Ig-like domain-containing protein, partial [Tannerella forsythia]